MDELKYELIDAILKFMLSNLYKLHLNFEGGEIRKHGFSNIEIRTELDILVNDNELINYFDKPNYVYILTKDGINAATIGIKKYLEEKEQDKQLDKDVKTASIKSSKLSKWAIGISIVAVVASFIVPFLVVNYEQHIKNPENINTTSQQRQNETDKSQSIRLTDSALIEYIKHDTIFLNELKKEIINENTKRN